VPDKAKGETVVLKRLPVAPREARTVSTSNNLPQTLTLGVSQKVSLRMQETRRGAD
jgi:hypothetical protein